MLWRHIVWYIVRGVPEESVASVFRVEDFPLFFLEDVGSTFLRIICKDISNYTTSHPSHNHDNLESCIIINFLVCR
jgi:hypothetical protein